jgi:hypothetical protein
MPLLVLLLRLLPDQSRWLLLLDRALTLLPLDKILDASEAGLVEAVDGVAS